MAWIFKISTLVLSIKVLVCLGNNCNKEDIENHVNVPLMSRIDAPLKAELDIEALTRQIKSLIFNDFKKEIEKAIDTALKAQLQVIKDDLRLQITETISASLKTLKDDGPAFTATFNGWTWAPLSRGEILKFDHVLLNRQNGYDPSTGYYTVPRPGVYLVTCTVRSNERKYLHVVLHKDDQPLLWAFGRDYNTGSLEAVLKLDKGEKLCIKNAVGDYVVSEEVQTGATSMFSVVYISK